MKRASELVGWGVVIFVALTWVLFIALVTTS